MTREEKIAELINIRDNFNYTLAPREVFDDAIEALEQKPLAEEDYIELHDLFGDYVEFVVRDMVSGKGERWKEKERMNDRL